MSNLLLDQAVLAACAAMCGLILILLAGTDLLDWPWILAILVLAMGFCGWRFGRRVPGRYAVAQAIDRRLGLQDSISTAFFHQHHARRKVSEDMVAAQFAAANLLASKVPVEKAVPYAAPRSLYSMAALGLAASGLFALRFGISHTLDLRAPLPKMVFDVFHFELRPKSVAKKEDKDKRLDQLLKQFGLSLDANAKQAGDGRKDAPPNPNAETTEVADRGEQRGAKTGKSAESQAPQQNENEPTGLSIPQEGNDNAQPGNDRDSAAMQASKGRQNQRGPQSGNSLLDKFRDALASLMSRLKSQPRSGEGQQFGSAGDGNSQLSQGRQPNGDQASQEQAGSDQNGLPGSQGNGEQQGDGTQQPAQGGQGKQGGRDSQRAAHEGNSGIGREDGAKDVKEAEQLAAMGKISEIIGKRSQTLTGDMMVEVTSSNQQIRTAYSQQSAAHTDAGGEINRDEVPLAYQRYVQQYFEEIRKAPPLVAKTGGAKQ